jgi:alpha-N-arabinofuranosidase
MLVRPETVSGISNPSFIGRRQQHLNCIACISMDFIPGNEYEKAGIIIFQGEEYFYFLCKSKKNDDDVVELFKSNKNKQMNNMEIIAERKLNISHNKRIYFKVSIEGKDIKFYHSEKQDEWINLADKVDGTFLSVKNTGGFVGTVIALYATSLNKDSTNAAYFDWFEYKGEDDVYKENELK